MNGSDPYRPPATEPAQSRDDSRSFILRGVIMWLVLAGYSTFTFVFVRPWFAEFEVALPTMTRWFLHPMSIVMCVMIAVAVILGGLMSEDPQQRKRTGQLAFAIGLIVFAMMTFAVISPIVSLFTALSA